MIQSIKYSILKYYGTTFLRLKKALQDLSYFTVILISFGRLY